MKNEELKIYLTLAIIKTIIIFLVFNLLLLPKNVFNLLFIKTHGTDTSESFHQKKKKTPQSQTQTQESQLYSALNCLMLKEGVAAITDGLENKQRAIASHVEHLPNAKTLSSLILFSFLFLSFFSSVPGTLCFSSKPSKYLFNFLLLLPFV